MAFKRRALPPDIPPHGIMEFLYVPELRKRGEMLFASNDIVVHHVQSHGFWNAFAIHYYAGRSIAGFRKLQSQSRIMWWRLSSCFILAPYLVLRSVMAVIQKRRFRRELILSLPLIAALACCHAAGEFVGYCTGLGNSAEKLS